MLITKLFRNPENKLFKFEADLTEDDFKRIFNIGLVCILQKGVVDDRFVSEVTDEESAVGTTIDLSEST
jgi:hypothetical protein